MVVHRCDTLWPKVRNCIPKKLADTITERKATHESLSLEPLAGFPAHCMCSCVVSHGLSQTTDSISAAARNPNLEKMLASAILGLGQPLGGQLVKSVSL